MEEVLKKDIGNELEEMKEKIARMKENLDAMYTNSMCDDVSMCDVYSLRKCTKITIFSDRFFVAAYQSERLWIWGRIEHNPPYFQKVCLCQNFFQIPFLKTNKN